MKRQPTIGLEIHAELKTQTKMFCDSLNDPEEKHPNANVCPVCAGHPGTLPTINKAAVESVLKVGMALKGDIPQFSKFDRKNYFYPDLPKGYQISQYDLPLIFGGVLNGVRLRRIHLEEDTGRLIHSEDGKSSFVDYNRAGVPLMELVTEPDITTADQAVEFAKELQLILRYLGVSDADMEKGQMRVEANVSVSADNVLGTKVEVKNINSFKAVHDAIEFEIKRQEEVLSSGGKIVQETRGWDDAKHKTVSQRIKEEAHDYRYFPEPDLPPLDLSKFDLAAIKVAVPELPKEKRLRFGKEYALKPEQAEVACRDRAVAEYFEEAASELKSEDARADFQLLYNYLTSDLFGLMAETGAAIGDIKIDPENFADLVILASGGKISSRTAKDILRKMLETGMDPNDIVKRENLGQISDESALEQTVASILEKHSAAVADFKKGKESALQFLIGKAMAELKGKGNPKLLQEMFIRKIS
ncbi:MAG: Aspartyl/glutamyl-tRNA(Asn/Gln) amidotransferase subunit B [Parcubacteria group bacterium GW2011_GWA2_47_8b]|uniref:Aspartyl/glutamyl-tRNA(Asn/Gln) amidotransferase subunit B n=1 Tax=Candidatus Harrisonbacteria bacterium RIFCSPHIGHO2_12_FULL_48_16 TaxID=1798405 RepID=A0A1G1ZK92_9BACT|nr:MAG: Aspartyl/glutamyl-tRNA(Asn/Gln) amidotransferase subunit B [Parcubacteria group bacterium GW2011_GWA2_47_8b]OGY65033.1 MAG: glutaminyl-tRNA synthase (glutamine-hydrolyzing) subunit B [Candidatus Harrisonbacteria bacterium RIFCSPHIGHO2_12_FULL_48_16]